MFSLLYLRGKTQHYFESLSYMFLDDKTLLKIWLNLGLNLIIFRRTGPWYLALDHLMSFTCTFCCFFYCLFRRFFAVHCTLPQNFKVMKSGKRNLTLTWEPAPHMGKQTSTLCYRILYASAQAKLNEVKSEFPRNTYQ